MKKYELMTIGKIGLGEKESKNLSQKIQEEITSLSGVVEKVDLWGKRKFAYQINHDTEGFYTVFKLEMDPEGINKLKTKLNLMSGLVRYLVTAE